MHLCKFCSSEALIKRGFARGKQRYFCKFCERHQVIGDDRERYSDKITQPQCYISRVADFAVLRGY
jgi:transposase-like protein